MKLSTRARYGTRALLDIALQEGERPVLLRDVARRQGISLLYLEHIVAPLVIAGILRSTRGPKGGVWLIKNPTEIKLSTVIQLLEGSIGPVDCVDNPEVCSRSNVCVTRDLWDELKKAIEGTLGSITLQDLIEQQKKKEQPVSIMYYV